MWTACWQAGFRRSDRFGRLRSYVRPLVRHRTAGHDIRQPWSLSLRRAWELVTNVGVSWAFVATMSFITSLRLPISSKMKRLSWKALSSGLGIQFGSEAFAGDIIADAILASLLARATATTRSGFLALMATIHSAKALLCLWATRNTDVHPTTSILRRYRLPFLVMAPSLSLPPLDAGSA